MRTGKAKLLINFAGTHVHAMLSFLEYFRVFSHHLHFINVIIVEIRVIDFQYELTVKA